MGFIHNFNPTLVAIGPVEIRWYGLAYLFGFLVAYLYILHQIKHKRLKMSKDDLYDWIFYMMLGVLVGSRIFHCLFWEPSYYLTRPWEILFIWQGGMSFHGGLIGIIIATVYFQKYKMQGKVSFARLGDIVAVPAAFALAIGRIANFINGELPGTKTEVSWCWYFPAANGCRHPQVLYSALKRFAVFGFLLYLSANYKKFKEGFIALMMITLFNFGRFFVDFFREDLRWLSLTAGQYLSITIVAVCVIIISKYYKKDLKKVFS